MPLNRCHVPSAPDISDCPSPQENSGGKKLTQAVQGFLGIFAVGFVAFLHMNFVLLSYKSVCASDTEQIQKKNAQPG